MLNNPNCVRPSNWIILFMDHGLVLKMHCSDGGGVEKHLSQWNPTPNFLGYVFHSILGQATCDPHRGEVPTWEPPEYSRMNSLSTHEYPEYSLSTHWVPAKDPLRTHWELEPNLLFFGFFSAFFSPFFGKLFLSTFWKMFTFWEPAENPLRTQPNAISNDLRARLVSDSYL